MKIYIIFSILILHCSKSGGHSLETADDLNDIFDRLDEQEKKLEKYKLEYEAKINELTGENAKLRSERFNARTSYLYGLPMGTILPWLPSPGFPGKPDENGIPKGWVLCDGQVISEGPWMNIQLPDMNGKNDDKGLFLRGSRQELAGQIEKDALRAHQHEDLGHTHTDSGHTHTDSGHTHTDAGHTHAGSFVDYISRGKWFQYATNIWGLQTHEFSTIPSSKANIQTSHAAISTNAANIQSSKAIIGGPIGDDVTATDETRPSNIRVVWIIKIQPAEWYEP